MRRWRPAVCLALLLSLPACNSGPASPTTTAGPTPVAAATVVPAPASPTPLTPTEVAAPTDLPDDGYTRESVPLIQRAETNQVVLSRGAGLSFNLSTGPFQLTFDPAADANSIWVRQPGQATA